MSVADVGDISSNRLRDIIIMWAFNYYLQGGTPGALGFFSLKELTNDFKIFYDKYVVFAWEENISNNLKIPSLVIEKHPIIDL